MCNEKMSLVCIPKRNNICSISDRNTFLLCQSFRLYDASSTQSDWFTTSTSNNKIETTISKFIRLHEYLPQRFTAFLCKQDAIDCEFGCGASCLPKSRSRIADQFRLVDPPSQKLKHSYNGAVIIECRAICSVITSTADAETHSDFHSAQTALLLRHLLIEMGYPQEPIHIKTDNSTTSGFVNNNLQMKHSKS